MACGTVDGVNASRGVFSVRCDDGSHAYFRVRDGDMPEVGDRVGCASDAAAVPRSIVNLSRDGRKTRLWNAVLGLPREVAFALLQ